jgi:hypothetical protein
VEVELKMASGRIRRTARRGIAAAILVWLGVAGLTVLMAPSASAAPGPIAIAIASPQAPGSLSLNAGDAVLFQNGIPPLTVPLVGTVYTDLTLHLPSGAKTLAPGQSHTETFNQGCNPCSVTFAYRSQSGAPLTGAILGQLPALPVNPLGFTVTVAVPSVKVPALPALPAVPALPALPQVNTPPQPGSPGGPLDPGGDGTTPEDEPAAPPIAAGADGAPYNYGLPADAPRMSAGDVVAAAAFDPDRFYVPGQSLGTADRAGSGGMAGSYDGASVPVFGQLAGLDGSSLDEESAQEAAAANASSAPTLPAAALAAVIALAAVTAALVRTHQAQRSSR